MKTRITLTILAVLIISSLAAKVEYFKENPASLSLTNYNYVIIPNFLSSVNFNNSLLRYGDIKIFDLSEYEDGEVMSEADKKILTKDDLKISADINATLIGFGKDNWGFRLGIHSHADVKLLDKQFSKLILYGNETNLEYNTDAGDKSIAYSFYKASFRYAFTEPFNFNKLLKVQEAADEGIVDYLKNMPIYYGINMNLYYPMYYAKANESTQQFGSFDDSLYYHTRLNYDLFDERSVGRLSASLGFGLMIALPDGWFHFRIDDIFGSINYRNLATVDHQEDFLNELFYLDPGYQPYHEISDNDSSRVNHKSVKFNPSIETGMEHKVIGNLSAIAKYKNVEYECKNGFSLGMSYANKHALPFELIFGFGDNTYYELNSGIKFGKLELRLGLTFYDGLFSYARGFGFGSELIYKF